MRPLPSRLLFALLSSAALLLSTPVRADLAADAERIARMWALHGARVERLPPLFLEHSRPAAVAVDRALVPAAPPVSPVSPAECLTVAFLSVRTAELVVEAEAPLVDLAAIAKLSDPLAALASRSTAPEDDHRTHSAGGAATLARCGPDWDALRRVSLEMISPRGAVEILVARSDKPLPELGEILPERTPGPFASRGDPGGAIEPGPLEGRLVRAERRARDEGAGQVVRLSMRASASGAGQFSLRLPDGCHRIELMAEVPSVVPRRITDLDAEAHEADGGRLLARDRADVPDARLDFCLGETTVVDIPFIGAAGAVGITLSDARWTLPLEVPVHWGARARAGLAFALRRRHGPEPKEAPILEAIGVQGVTRIPFETEPGRCYLAAAAMIRGEARALRVSAAIGDRAPHDEPIDKAEGAAVAFCAGTESSAVLEIDARGNGPWWAFVVWPMGGTGL